MKSPLELAVPAQLHTDNLIEKQTHEIERLSDGVTFLACVSHFECGPCVS